MQIFKNIGFKSHGSSDQPAAQSFVARHGFLSVKEHHMVGQSGERVMLRGMSLFWSQWQSQYFNFNTVRWLRDDWMINIIRAPLAVHAGGYSEYPEREQQKVEAVIEAAIALGIYVVVDWHTHHPDIEMATGFFLEIARKYGAFPNLIYEIWNEPAGNYDWRRVIKPYHGALIEKIRSVDERNIIIAGTQNWCRDVEVAANDPLIFNNVAYALHFYASSHRQPLRDKAELALRMGAPLMVTEFGSCGEDGDGPLDVDEVRRWWKFLESRQISYINWAVADKKESSAALIPGASGEGGWSAGDLTASGQVIRQQLRKCAR